MIPYYFSVFLKDDGHVFVSGINDCGQLGLGHTNIVNTITMIPDLENIEKVFTGYDYNFFISNNGNVYFCGNKAIANYIGLGYVNITIPTLVPKLNNIVEIKTLKGICYFKCKNNNYYKFDENHELVKAFDDFKYSIKNIEFVNAVKLILTNSGDVYSIGSSDIGELGLGRNITSVTEYTKINELSNVTKLIGTNAIAYDGKVYSWGNCIGTTDTNEFSPVERIGLPFIKSLSFSNNHIMFLSKEGDIYGMSDANNYGYLGYGNNNPIKTIIKNPYLSNIKKVICAMFSTVFIDENNDVYICGYVSNKNYGAIPDRIYTTPTKLDALSNIISVNDTFINVFNNYTIFSEGEEFFYDNFNIKQTINSNSDINGIRQNAYKSLIELYKSIIDNDIKNYKVKRYYSESI